MKHLVFVSKDTGLTLSKILIESFPDDDYTFVVFSNIKKSFLDFIVGKGYEYLDYSESAIEKIQNDNIQYDWLLNLWGGHIFSQTILDVADKSLNIHPSFLPVARGSDPVVWTLRNGWKAGCSLHVITPEVDEGPIWIQKEISYEMPITGGSLYKLVIEECIKLFQFNWSDIRSGKIDASSQIKNNKTYYRRELLEDRLINTDVDNNAWNIINKLLAHDFSPGYESQVIINNKKFNAKLILSEVNNDE